MSGKHQCRGCKKCHCEVETKILEQKEENEVNLAEIAYWLDWTILAGSKIILLSRKELPHIMLRFAPEKKEVIALLSTESQITNVASLKNVVKVEYQKIEMVIKDKVLGVLKIVKIRNGHTYLRLQNIKPDGFEIFSE